MANVFCLNVRKFEMLNLLFLFVKKRSKCLLWTSSEHEECVPLYGSISVLVYEDESKHLGLCVR